MPLTTAGAVSSGVGFFGGWLAVGGLLWLLTAPIRMMRRPRAVVADGVPGARRVEPTFASNSLVAVDPAPKFEPDSFGEGPDGDIPPQDEPASKG